ncbi:hypothetical protein AB0N05_21340 [Nocardia sp. NPDC051030]|uniref:hypothetical protein n=1 Tax=Nocardia sp. NPDC051030 TaxID=3155162 RepID=UPI003433DFB5
MSGDEPGWRPMPPYPGAFSITPDANRNWWLPALFSTIVTIVLGVCVAPAVLVTFIFAGMDPEGSAGLVAAAAFTALLLVVAIAGLVTQWAIGARAAWATRIVLAVLTPLLPAIPGATLLVAFYGS